MCGGKGIVGISWSAYTWKAYTSIPDGGWGVGTCIAYGRRIAIARVEQAADPKMHVLSGALVAQPRYLLLVLNNYSPDSNKLTGHRKHA